MTCSGRRAACQAYCLQGLEAHTLPHTRASLLTCKQFPRQIQSKAGKPCFRADRRGNQKLFMHLRLLLTGKESCKSQYLRHLVQSREREPVQESPTYLFRAFMIIMPSITIAPDSLPNHVYIKQGLANHGLSAKSGLPPIFVQPMS